MNVDDIGNRPFKLELPAFPPHENEQAYLSE
jgi:hypothetical protein